MASLYWTCLFFLPLFSNGDMSQEEGVSKRLLLTDPSAFLSRMEALEKKVQALETQLNNDRKTGATYIRWGRKGCPLVNGTTLLYSGIAAGRFFNTKGDGINTLCMPHDPDHAPLDLPAPPNGDHFGRLYGSEYEFNYKNIVQNEDVPCAVCHDIYATSSLMIPGKTVCPGHWTKQFDGFLTSEAHYSDHYGAEYLCLDKDPEYATEGSRQNDYNGRIFYPVEAVCGSLPCPPYDSGKYVSCVVCTN